MLPCFRVVFAGVIIGSTRPLTFLGPGSFAELQIPDDHVARVVLMLVDSLVSLRKRFRHRVFVGRLRGEQSVNHIL